MAVGDVIVCLDIGSSKVSGVVGQVNKFNEIEVIGYGFQPCDGLKKGQIVDSTILSKTLRKVVQECEDIAGIKIKSAYINVKGMHAKKEKKTEEVDVEDYNKGISYSDISKAYNKLKEHSIYDYEQVLDIIPTKYYTDEKETNLEPIGVMCKTLKVEADIILSKDKYVEKLDEIMKSIGLKIDGAIIETLATGTVILVPEEKELGVLFIDVGATTTEVSAYKNSKLMFNDTLPVGGENITNDISIVLGLDITEAERLKKTYNLAMLAMISNDHDVKIKKDGIETTIKSSNIVEIIEARVCGIYNLIKKIVDNEKINDIIECVVITGQGISNIVGAEEQAVLNLKTNNVRVCNPKLINIIKQQHVTAYGMVKYITAISNGRFVNSDVETIIQPTIKETVINKITKAKDIISNLMGKRKG